MSVSMIPVANCGGYRSCEPVMVMPRHGHALIVCKCPFWYWSLTGCLVGPYQYLYGMARRTKRDNGNQSNGKPLMGDKGWVVSSSHTDNPKSLTICFEIPKDRYKGSNSRDPDAVLRQKTTWLREHGEMAWTQAIINEFGVEAIEPEAGEWLDDKETGFTPTESEAYTAMEQQQTRVDELKLKMAEADAFILSVKAARRGMARSSQEYQDMTAKISEVEAYRKDISVQSKLELKLLTKARNNWSRVHAKQDRRRLSLSRKAYLAAKHKANEGNLIFPGRVDVDIESNIVTGHDFDAPNCWPSVKPLQDGGTDTCVLWRDDNNNYIRRTSFYGGGKNADCYLIRIKVTEVVGTDAGDSPFTMDGTGPCDTMDD